MRVYLAGPDVFLPEPLARAAALKTICARHGLMGVFPMDAMDAEPADWAKLPDFRRIALRNEAHIRASDALIANLTPFRGPSADAGTVFEIGFMRALRRPVFGWSNTSVDFLARSRDFLGSAAWLAADGQWRDGAAMALERFGCTDNLMIDGAVLGSGGVLELADVPADRVWSDLAAFERCVVKLATKRPPADR